MAITDSGAAADVRGSEPSLVVEAGGAWFAGDLVGLNSSGAWVQADTDAPIQPLMVAGTSVRSGALGCPLYVSAVVKGGRYSGGTPGNLLYASATAGLVASDVATTMGVPMPVGWVIEANAVFLMPSLSLAAIIPNVRN